VTSTTTGLEFYESSSAPAPATSFALINGRRILWVTSKVAISNGQFAVKPDTVNTVVGSDPRDKIYFLKSPVMNNTIPHRIDKEFCVTFFDLRGRLVYSKRFRSCTSPLRPDKQLSQFRRSMTPAVYLVQISEKGPRSSVKNHRVYKLMLR
jgi:hypothetical protein